MFRPGGIAGLDSRLLILEIQNRGVILRHDFLVLLIDLILLLGQFLGGSLAERIGYHRLDEETADGQRRHQNGDDQHNRDSLALFSFSAHGLHLPLNASNGIREVIITSKINASLRNSSQDCKIPSFTIAYRKVFAKMALYYIRSGASMPIRYRPVLMTARVASVRATRAAAWAGSPSRMRCS